MLYEILEKLDISYQEIDHEAFFTVEDASIIQGKIEGIGCKNLFLTDGKKYYLYILKDNQRANFKKLTKILGVSKLSFASHLELFKYLNLTPGSVTPFGILYDVDNLVTVLLDSRLKNQKLLFHPNVNTKTISIHTNDLLRFLEYENHVYFFLDESNRKGAFSCARND